MPPVFACVTPHPPILVPEVGRGRQHQVQDTLDAMTELRVGLAASEPEVLVFICPHGVVTRDRFHILRGELEGDLSRFEASDVRFRAQPDSELIDATLAEAADRGVRIEAVDHWEPNDHSAWVPLYFLQEAVPDVPVMMISVSFGAADDHYALGRVVAEVISKLRRRAAIIASADGAHTLKEDGPYGFHPASLEFEERFHRAFRRWDLHEILNFETTFRLQAGEDSIPSVAFLMGALSHCEVEPRVLASEGPWGVGYMTAVVEIGDERGYGEPEPLAIDESPTIVRIAKAAVAAYVRDGKVLEDAPFAEASLREERHGAFVTILTPGGELRGCMGTTEATEERLLDEVVRNAIAAASRDPRFDPVRPEELDGLHYKVDVLGESEPIDSTAELDPRRYGVIVESGELRGLLLPDLDGIDSAAEQVSIAMGKAGIRSAEEIRLRRFEVTRFEEHDAGETD